MESRLGCSLRRLADHFLGRRCETEILVVGILKYGREWFYRLRLRN